MNRLLKNGLLNTLLASSPFRESQQKPLRKKLNSISSKEIFKSSNSQFIEVFQTNNFSKKVIFFPGWLGHKDSKYLIPLADLLYSRGFDILRIHPIDHGDSEHLNEDFFRATDIRALIEVVKYLGQKFSNNELHLIGFSLGGNISLRISASPEINFLKKTIVLSPVINPENSMNAMDKNSWILRKYFIDKWKKTIRRKIDLYNINAKEALKHKNIKSLTEYFTENFTPHSHLRDLFSAYAVTQETLNNINHDTFIYSAYDDPCVPIEPLLELEETTNVEFNALDYGGHCGFIDDFRFTSSLYHEISKKLESSTH